jgi:serine/threonine protein kinase
MARFDDLPPSSDKPLEPRPEAPLDEDLDDATIPAHAPNVTRVRPGNAGGVQSGSSDRSGSSEVNAGSGGTPGSFDAFEEPQTRIVAPATVFGHRFEVVKQIGRGGMGEVFLVRDRQIESREVALKLVRSKYSRDARYRELFFQEIRSSQGFVSEHVVQVRDVGQLEDGQLFLTMDYVKGESLSRLLRREKVIQPRHALEITRQVLLGLSSGHERGLIHRDVKPSNIMLEGRAAKTESNPFGVKVGLLDFGLAALTEHVKEGRQPGTPQYMSPEQASGQRLDARSDLFAVGVLLYEMVSGQRPFEGATEDEITQSVIDTNLVPLIDSLDGVDKGLKRILRKALQKEREKRFPSAAEFISAIEKNNAFLGERTSGSWLSFSTAALAILSVGLSFLYSQSRTEVTELKASLQSQGTERRFGDLDQFDRQELQSSLDAVRAEVKEQRALLANRDQRISQLEAERSGLRGELDAAERKMIDLELAQKDAVDKRLIYKTESDGEVVLIRRANEALTASLFALWAKYEALQMNRGRSRELVLAGSLDDLLGGIANSSIHLAGNAPIQAAISERGVSAHSPGVAYLLDLERAAKTLTRAADSALIETSSLKDYASALATVERLSSQATFAAFESEVGGGSERWIGAVEMRDQDVEALLRERLADPSAYSNSLDRVLERERQAAVEQAIEAGKLSGWLAEIDPGKRPATQPLLGELDSNIQFVLGRNFTDPDQVREVQRLLFGEDYQPSVANERLEQIKAALAALRQMGVAVQEQFEGQVAAASQELVVRCLLQAASRECRQCAGHFDFRTPRGACCRRPWLAHRSRSEPDRSSARGSRGFDRTGARSGAVGERERTSRNLRVATLVGFRALLVHGRRFAYGAHLGRRTAEPAVGWLAGMDERGCVAVPTRQPSGRSLPHVQRHRGLRRTPGDRP